MRQIMKLSWLQLGAQKILSYSLFLVVTATCITGIILSGLAKDKCLASLLPATAAALPANIQYGLAFYNFEILFLRSGTLLVKGFLAYYLIVDAWKNHNLMHWAAYPFYAQTALFWIVQCHCIVGRGVISDNSQLSCGNPRELVINLDNP